MSEKIYVWLLRLYPSRFREAYGDEALQLFRDRARDEKGFFASVRLWLDLLVDLAVSVPRQYRHANPALIGASAQQRLDRLPSFHVLESESPRLGALLSGGVLTLVALWGVSVLNGHAGNDPPQGASVAQSQAPAYASSAFSGPTPQAANDVEEETTASLQSRMYGTNPQSGDANPGNFQSNPFLSPKGSEFSQPQAQPPKVQAAAQDDDVKLGAAERHRVIAGAIAILKEDYIDPAVAQKTADALLAHEKSGDDDAATDGAAFADLLTRQMADASHDQYLVMVYYRVTPPDRPRGPPPPELVAQYRKEMEQNNCTFERVKILPHNIGYLKFNSFPDVSICRPTVVAAMAQLNHVDAIIFDLRDNHGGSVEMVALIATYLFDHPAHMNDFYDRKENSTEESWTLPPIPGNKLVDKPAYVLTSGSSFSAAEAFSYDLKMLKRVTLVGETTSGRGHMGLPHRIDDHFAIRVPGIRAINPISKTNWAGTGVEPDVKVKAEDALATAEKLAENKPRKK
ncbi:MAG TPA: S41 family peptidase [Candidatus Angelobacter sp.]